LEGVGVARFVMGMAKTVPRLNKGEIFLYPGVARTVLLSLLNPLQTVPNLNIVAICATKYRRINNEILCSSKLVYQRI
jgi:hypothetical protein